MSSEVPQSLEFLHWLKVECGYRNVRPLPGGRWAATNQFMYTCAILVGKIGDRHGVDDRWCYHDQAAAAAALEAWDGLSGEPRGWHRHPASGRRVKDGVEYVAP